MLRHQKIKSVPMKQVGGDIHLDLPMDKVDETMLPFVSILTITKNRKKMFPIAIQNYKSFRYPRYKLEWVIIDDSTNPDQDLTTLLSESLPGDSSIKYIKTPPVKTIGDKRNLSVEKASYNVLVNMDDDDFYFPDSVLAKVLILQHYEKNLIYSPSIGIYDTDTNASFIGEHFSDVPEASLAFIKEFWKKNKFGSVNRYECYNMVRRNEKTVIKVPFWFNLIVLNHGSNTTGKMRSRSFTTEQVKTSNTFLDSFTPEIKEILNNF